MKKLPLFLLVFTVSVISLLSCKKGDDGAPGAPGTANVKFSAWFTPTTYQKDTIFGSWGFKYIQAAPEITQKIIDSGAVLIYGKLLGYNPLVWPTNYVSQLPIVINYVQGGNQIDTWSGHAFPGNVRIRFVNNNNIYTTIATQHQFRYIVIPGGVPVGRGITLSYEDICRRYNIPL